MSLLNKILKWTESDLVLWQRDAARRLFQNESVLSAQDYDELYTLLKATHGIPNTNNLQPVPLAASHLPAIISGVSTVTLKSMHDLTHVNRIAPRQTLKFSPDGITVIYGGNGSGKSGYSRVLKQACRARDQSETVHPDATDPTAQKSTPEAQFDIQTDGTSQTLKWIRDTIPPDELSTIAVFDSHCARAYLSEGEAAYQPYGLDIVENLAQVVIPELNKRLKQELVTINVDDEPFKHLLGNTAVGKMIASLSEKTDPASVKKLSTLSPKEIERISELDKILVEANPKIIAKQIQQVRLSAQRLAELIKRIDTALTWVSDTAVNKLKKLDDTAQSATHAETIAAAQFRAGEDLLPGTGEPAWKFLFEAARRFSTEAAYTNDEFPHVGEDTQCPLCQQPLGEDASNRLKRFELYIQDNAATVAQENRTKLDSSIKKIESANLDIVFDDTLAEELLGLDSALVNTVHIFESIIIARRVWMLDAVKIHKWDDTPLFGDDPRQALHNIAAKLTSTADEMVKASDESKRKSLEAERDELRARQNLRQSINAIIGLIENKKFKHALESCKSDLKTRPISNKSTEFASNAITPDLKKSLDVEFNNLGISHVRTKLNGRNDRGKMIYRLSLDFPVTSKIEEILSEGEQRAIAIGSFLAELSLANHSGGIVFDDPVSSLDHYRRQKVARRLVEEAMQRQVIVLTHDTAFLGELRYSIDQAGVPNTMHYLEWRDDQPGHINEGLPWIHMGYKQRIKHLEDCLRNLEHPWPAYPSESQVLEIRNLYSLLRATIERVAEDLILNGIVQRYNEYINVGNLHKIMGFETQECEKIQMLHKKCHGITDAHDPSSIRNTTIPTAQEFGDDLKSLKVVIDDIKNSRKTDKEPVAAS